MQTEKEWGYTESSISLTQRRGDFTKDRRRVELCFLFKNWLSSAADIPSDRMFHNRRRAVLCARPNLTGEYVVSPDSNPGLCTTQL